MPYVYDSSQYLCENFFRRDEGDADGNRKPSFAAEFQNEVKNIEPSDYALLIDTKELDAAPGGEEQRFGAGAGYGEAAPFKVRYSFVTIDFSKDREK